MARAWPTPGLTPEISLRQAARRVLAVRIAELYSYAPFIHDPARIAELHDMRIAAKRLRYTLEIFQIALPDSASEAIEQAKEIQELLGQIHDDDVLASLVEERLETIDQEAHQSLLAYLHDEPKAAARLAGVKERLQPAERDRRIGLSTLLGRIIHRRRQRHKDFVALWTRLETRRFRAALETLTQPPPPAA